MSAKDQNLGKKNIPLKQILEPFTMFIVFYFYHRLFYLRKRLKFLTDRVGEDSDNFVQLKAPEWVEIKLL